MDSTVIQSFRTSIRVIEREIERQFSTQDCCCGVSVSECHMMMELDQKGEQTLTQLSLSLDLDKSTLSRTADELYNSGLIERSENRDDRRFTDLRLSDKGKNAAKEIYALWNKIYLNIFNYIPEEKQTIVMESIKIFADALKENRKNNEECKG